MAGSSERGVDINANLFLDKNNLEPKVGAVPDLIKFLALEPAILWSTTTVLVGRFVFRY